MTTDDLIEKLASVILERSRPAIPLNIDLWDIETIAAYMKLSNSSVRERFACLPDFPKAIRLPSKLGKKAHPLYKAKEVIEWVGKYQER